MTESEQGTATPHYDRDFLLSPDKHNQVRLATEPLAALRRKFTQSDLHIYDVAAPHGRRAMLFGSNRWPR